VSRVQPKVFRSTSARVVAWVWLVFAAANLVDIAVRGHDLAGMIAAAVLLLGSGVAYVLGLRPRIVADESGVRLHNPLRDVRVPWPAVREIDATESVRVSYVAEDGEERRVGAWAMQTSPRARARAQRRSRRRTPEGGGVPTAVAEYARNRTPADYVADQLTELAAEHRSEAPSEGRRPAVTWSLPAIITLAVPGAALAILVLAATLT
jgi:PH (Pleckstrin Homology) domain-containing protein